MIDLEFIQAEWDKDSVIDRGDPDPLSIDQLHNKYLRYLNELRMEMIPLSTELDQLLVDKEEFFLNPTEETAKERKWRYPKRGKILKTELKKYLAHDQDVVDMQSTVRKMEIRIEFLEDILKRIHNRSFIINAHIEWEKVKLGIK